MRKSEQYRIAQLAVLGNGTILNSTKLEIIKTLQNDEDMALLVEKRESEKE